MPKVAELNALYPTDCNVQLRIRQLHLDWHYHIANGYIVYSKGGKVKLYEHRLVADAAYGQLPDGYHIHHIDENRINNRAGNLQVLSHEEHALVHNPGHQVICAQCSKPFTVHKKRILRTKSGDLFCSRKCQNKHHCPNKPTKEQLADYLNNSIGVCDIARTFNVSHTSIRRWINEYGIGA